MSTKKRTASIRVEGTNEVDWGPDKNRSGKELFIRLGLDALRRRQTGITFDDLVEWYARTTLFTELTGELLQEEAETRACEEFYSGAWVQSGMPTIKMDATVAAELVWAQADPDVLEDLRAPWRVFVIEVPNGFFRNFTHVLVAWHPDEGLGFYSALGHQSGQDKVGVDGRFNSFRTLLKEADVTIGGLQTTPENERECQALKNLIVNVCIASTEPNKGEPNDCLSAQRVGRGKKRDKRYPVPTHYVLRPPVLIERKSSEKKELLTACRNYLRSGTPTLGVRTWVRGHWRNQVCGRRVRDAEGILRWAQRRRTFIPSYLRGPEDGPVAVHPHVLCGSVMDTDSPTVSDKKSSG